jgi:hypothetical protein
MVIDYLALMKRDWEDIDTQVCICDICGKKGLCKILKRGRKRLAICEDCFIEDSDRFYPLDHKELNRNEEVQR